MALRDVSQTRAVLHLLEAQAEVQLGARRGAIDQHKARVAAAERGTLCGGLVFDALRLRSRCEQLLVSVDSRQCRHADHRH